jgi:hypothetical protein
MSAKPCGCWILRRKKHGRMRDRKRSVLGTRPHWSEFPRRSGSTHGKSAPAGRRLRRLTVRNWARVSKRQCVPIPREPNRKDRPPDRNAPRKRPGILASTHRHNVARKKGALVTQRPSEPPQTRPSPATRLSLACLPLVVHAYAVSPRRLPVGGAHHAEVDALKLPILVSQVLDPERHVSSPGAAYRHTGE